VIKTPSQRLSRNPSAAGYSNPLRSYSVPATDNPDGTINVPAQPVYLIDPITEPIPIGGNVIIRTLTSGSFTTSNSGALAIGATGIGVNAPAGHRWVLINVTIQVTCTATVGNRAFYAWITDGTNVQWTGALSGLTTAAQVCGYDIMFGSPASTPSTTVRRLWSGAGNTNIQVRESAPALWVPPNGLILIDDVNNIDNADSVEMHLMYIDQLV